MPSNDPDRNGDAVKRQDSRLDYISVTTSSVCYDGDDERSSANFGNGVHKKWRGKLTKDTSSPPSPDISTIEEQLADKTSELYAQVRDADDEEMEVQPPNKQEKANPLHVSDDDCCYRFLNKCRPCHRCMAAWPRSCSLLLGVILPMLFLSALSLLLGIVLARAEAPQEIRDNDERLQSHAEVNEATQLLRDITSLLPVACFELFVLDETEGNLTEKVGDGIRKALNTGNAPHIFDLMASRTEIVPINLTDAHEFMYECGKAGEPAVSGLFQRTGANLSDIYGSLTFNWIRCVAGATDGVETFNWLGSTNFSAMQPEAQRAYYLQTWMSDQQRIYGRRLEEMGGANSTTPLERLNAFQYSVNKATGGSTCSLNASASGWFWFTVLTTVGYGNYVPSTCFGRKLVFVLGFITILLFGWILATAGLVASAIFDDALHRCKLHMLTSPWFSCLVWGTIYYGWMAFIAGVTLDWKRVRLHDYQFDIYRGYWFAYVSSTTIGFGDTYLQPEVMLWYDLITFPMLFLASFVYIAAFLGKFSDCFGSVCGRRTLVELLLDRLKKTNLPVTEVVVDRVVSAGANAVERTITTVGAGRDAVASAADATTEAALAKVGGGIDRARGGVTLRRQKRTDSTDQE